MGNIPWNVVSPTKHFLDLNNVLKKIMAMGPAHFGCWVILDLNLRFALVYPRCSYLTWHNFVIQGE
jgi:hypothetical protein